MTKTTNLLLGVGLCAVSQLAVAGANEYVLSYSAHDLRTPAAVERLHARILKTARRHCPTYQEVRSIAEINACVADVVDDLVAKVEHPELTAYHRGGWRSRLARAARASASPST